MRLNLALLFLPVAAAMAADPYTDPEYLNASPLERLENLNKWRGNREIKQANVLRYMHEQGGGSPAGELKAFHFLVKRNQDKEWKNRSWRISMNEHAQVLDWYFFATVTQSGAWKKGSSLDRWKMLVAFEKNEMLDGHLQENLVLRTMCEFVHEQSRDAAPAERAKARLDALDQLAEAGILGPDEFTSKLNPTIEHILLEYFLNDPAVSGMTHAEKWEHLNELVKTRGINPWAHTQLDLMIVPFALKEDAAFMAKDAAGREEHIKQLAKDRKVAQFSEKYLLKRFVKPDEGLVPDMEDLLDQQAGFQEASPAMKLVKIQQLLREKTRFHSEQFDARVRLIFAQHTLSLKEGALTPAIELERVKELKNLEVDGQKPLQSFAHNTLKDSLVLLLYGFIMDDVAFKQATPEEQFNQVIELQDLNIARFSGALRLMLMDYVLPPVLGVPPGERGLARMKSLARLGKAGFDQNSLPLKDEAEFAFQHFLTFDTAFTELSVKQKMQRVKELDEQNLLMGFTSRDHHKRVLIPALKRDPGFLQADAAGKMALIEELVEAGLLKESRVSYLKSALRIK